MSSPRAIAITGIGCAFPGAADPESFWEHIAARRDLAREVPGDRWYLPPDASFSSEIGREDHAYARKGCFVDAAALPLDFAPADQRDAGDGLRIDPSLLADLDPLFRVLLYAGQQAFRDARASARDHTNAGVILGCLALPTEFASALARESLGSLFEERLLGDSAHDHATHPLNLQATGLPANLLAHALGLYGVSYTLDAACASSLYALKLACDELESGRADLMLAGGVSRPDCVYTQMGFSQLRALSPKGRCAPFDRQGDGLVVGEGAGVFVLKRIEDAERDGDHIYGVIRGIGLSNDVGGRLLAPTSEGQLRAMRAAYTQAGWNPEDVDLVECHATGTPVGDAVEFESLRALWEQPYAARSLCVIGSVKSNIGHLLTAAGSASMLKMLLAMKHRALPPTANFEALPEALSATDTPFTVLRETREWPKPEALPGRRAAVSAFGFGGINAHVLIEEHVPSTVQGEVSPQAKEVPIAIVGMDAYAGPWDSLRAFQERVFGGVAREEALCAGAWWGAQDSAWLRRKGLHPESLHGFYIKELELIPGEFRIPPKELEQMLPQQLLMLKVAARAWKDAGANEESAANAGVFIGAGLDPNTTNFHVRWNLANKAKGWARHLDIRLDGEAKADWVRELRDAFGPPLTANRTMGALASIAASRIARELRIGGPSFTLSNGECSGLSALEAGMRALQRGELDTALVGAVDMAGDLRAVLNVAGERSVPGDGAAALVLKRIEDAQRDGDRVYALIQGLEHATVAPRGLESESGTVASAACHEVPPSTGLLVAADAQTLANCRIPEQERAFSCAASTVVDDVGHAGAASALLALAKAALCLYQEVIPPFRGIGPGVEAGLAERGFSLPARPRHWLSNRAEGPRQGLVVAAAATGGRALVLLEEAPPAAPTDFEVARTQPLGARHEALFVVSGSTPSEMLVGITRLNALVEDAPEHNIEALARRWWRESGNGKPGRLSLAMVARAVSELLDQLDYAQHALQEDPGAPLGPQRGPARESHVNDRIFYNPEPLGASAQVAFVFPGSGNHYPGMGRELLAQFPEVLRRQHKENGYLRTQFQPEVFWNAEAPEDVPGDHKALIFGQVSLGAAVSDLVQRMGIRPNAVLGYSLGETAGLFATRTWTGRDDMLARMNASRLFTDDLAGDCDAARKTWQLPKQEAVDWVLGVIDIPMKVARTALKNRKKVYPLIANTLHESVVGGNRKAVEKFITQLQCQFIPLSGVTTVHCEIVKEVEEEYRALHLFDTAPPRGITFYSSAWGRSYDVTRESAADSILAQALDGVDFPQMVETAYEDGARIFIEMGPGNSCSRMITRILGDRPHLARSACHQGPDAVSLFLRVLAQLLSEGVNVDLQALYGVESRALDHLLPEPLLQGLIRIPVGGAPFLPPKPKRSGRETPPVSVETPRTPDLPWPLPSSAIIPATYPAVPVFENAGRVETAKGEAHEAFLAFSNQVSSALAESMEFQMRLAASPAGWTEAEAYAMPETATAPAPSYVAQPARAVTTEVPRSLPREACLQFAIGHIADVLGPAFAEVDTFPTRVRLPDGPLMLVDRILDIEGKAKKLGPGRVITEHEVHASRWYLDAGRIPTAVAVEAGQADLFLSGFLGIDFETRGLAKYRLLDAEVTFHRTLPVPGEVIRYDIRILEFFRHGNPWFFRFEFDGMVDGAPLITMRNGCAGFFTDAELAAGQGVVTPSLDQGGVLGKRPGDWRELAPMAEESYSAMDLDALRKGGLAACFGSAFAKLPLRDPIRLPGGMLHLVDRVTRLEPQGGRYGLGSIRAEADIHPDDWFLTCHFVDDQVMPGTLMYECCLHTLRIFLMRLGWVGESDEVHFGPVPGVTSRLKCRGQVLATTRVVTYEVTLKEFGYRPEPYAIADARMYADGKPIVDITDMCTQANGLDRARVEAIWSTPAPDCNPKPAVYDYGKILAFAIGNPSEAFGDRYKPFDSDRVIARLPGPPYDFMTRVTRVTGEPWVQSTAHATEAQYDVPPDAWYFDESRQDTMPFAVVLEVALQPCGWLAAYMGSALTSESDLKFRNLGGAATQYRDVTRDTGLLTVNVRVTKVSSSGGMIIQHYDMTVDSPQGRVYDGATYFGFFSKESLAQQVGVRGAAGYLPDAKQAKCAESFAYPEGAPYPEKRWRMIDRVDCFLPEGGPNGLGYIRGAMNVDPEAWFFKAHFHQDPVCPGSLGLESFLQLLKVVAVRRWNLPDTTRIEAPVLGTKHAWIYRGQIIPTNHEVTVEASITHRDDEKRTLQANGLLIVDGKVIYQIEGFHLQVP